MVVIARMNRRPAGRVALPLVAAVVLAACSQRPSTDDFFPLQPGLRWNYEVHEHSAVTDARRELSIRNLGTETRADHRYTRRLASDGNEYWLEVVDGRLQRSGLRTAIDREPRLDITPLTVLKMPPEVGQAWEIETWPYILERIEPFRERFSQDRSKRVEMRMQVTALDAMVEVPAGRFENCLRLDGEAVLNVLADARIGASEVPITQTEWYAPGVGLVLLEREEKLDTLQIVGGKVRMQLLSFED